MPRRFTLEPTCYNEVFVAAEYFLRESGIRQFCREECQGVCCLDCWDSVNACHRTDLGRLSCTIFLCHSMKSFFDPRLQRAYEFIQLMIEREVARLLPYGRNPYFTPFPDKMKPYFYVNRTIVSLLRSTEFIERAREALNRGREPLKETMHFAKKILDSKIH